MSTMQPAFSIPHFCGTCLAPFACTVLLLLYSSGVSGIAQTNQKQDGLDNPTSSKPVPSSQTEVNDGDDRITLQTQEPLSGKISQDSFSFITPYGRIDVPRKGIDKIQVGVSNLHSLYLNNQSRFTGILDETILPIIASTGKTNLIRVQKISLIEFPRSQVQKIETPSFEFQMRNTDRIYGQIAAPSLSILMDNTPQTVSINDLFWLSMEPNFQAQICLRQNVTNRCVLKEEDFTVEIGTGISLHLYAGAIESVARMNLVNEAVNPMASNWTHKQPLKSSTQIEGMQWIPPGEFVMGSRSDEVGQDNDEGPLTRVVFTNGFWIGKYEVTQGEFESVMGVNLSIFTGNPRRPVERVSWNEAREYCTRLTAKTHESNRLHGFVYRLPTEAEWEYACRAGTRTRFSYGDDPDYAHLGLYAWHMGNSDSTTHPVGEKKPNPWGLYDMHGNVWEWCLDRWEDGYPGDAITNRSSLAQGFLRTARGGSWLYDGKSCRSANRDDYGPSNRCSDVGFRIVLVPAE